MDAARKQQFAHVEAAQAQLLSWAGVHDVPLVRVEFVVPFVDSDFSLSVWLFYDTDVNVRRCDEDGTTAKVREEFLAILAADAYPAHWLPGVAFYVDSHDNVELNYGGSYFYRLR